MDAVEVPARMPEVSTVAWAQDLAKMLDRPTTVEVVQVAQAWFATPTPSPSQIARVADLLFEAGSILRGAVARWTEADGES